MRETVRSTNVLVATAAVGFITLLSTTGGANKVVAEEAPREGECDPNPFPDTNPGPGSLKAIPVPVPPNLSTYVRNRDAAIALGKALFWDMQVGSDGIQACASCHFRAGADPRQKNQLNPGGQDNTNLSFTLGGPNHNLVGPNFPFHKLADPFNRRSAVIQDFDEVASSQGVKLSRFDGAKPGDSADDTTTIDDPVFNINGKNSRRSEPRNTPTVFNAAFTRRNFWDGRADHIFNGVNPFGVRDTNARIVEVASNGSLNSVKARIDNGSLASQAVGPPLSDREMGSVGRRFPDVGRRLLTAEPLKQQEVHWNDSVLGSLANSTPGSMRKGLSVSYQQLVFQAFKPEWWNSNRIVLVNSNGYITGFAPNPNRALRSNEFTVAEYNFSLFFGLAVQLYESTLITDQAPIDSFFEGQSTALTADQIEGMEIFKDNACAGCHSGAEFTNSSLRILNGANGEPAEIVERMLNGNCEVVLYEQSFYNLGVRPTAEDLGQGNLDPFGNPLSTANILTTIPSQIPSQELLTIPYPNIANPPPYFGERTLANGAFKVPSLRNIALTAPYFHNGGQATLRQVVEFYNRGGDFRETNARDIDLEIGALGLTSAQIDKVVAFMESLTDPRVLEQKAPFDHPQILVPNGHNGGGSQGTAGDNLVNIPAVGRNGGPAPPAFLSW